MYTYKYMQKIKNIISLGRSVTMKLHEGPIYNMYI